MILVQDFFHNNSALFIAYDGRCWVMQLLLSKFKALHDDAIFLVNQLICNVIALSPSPHAKSNWDSFKLKAL